MYDEEDRENIELIPQKASAGYLNGYADPEYIREQPRFRLPFLPSNATYRAFEISGDSMLPIKSVRDRLFQWRGSVDEDFSDIYALFESKRDDFIKICKAGILEQEDVSDIEEYLTGFFASVSTPKAVKDEILKARKK